MKKLSLKKAKKKIIKNPLDMKLSLMDLYLQNLGNQNLTLWTLKSEKNSMFLFMKVMKLLETCFFTHSQIIYRFLKKI